VPDPAKVRILSDAPACADFFHSHENVAAAIGSLIRNETDRGKAIALSGQWGSGKSTVIEMVREQLAGQRGKGQPDTRMFLFDAWSHQGDPLRRSFLESLAKFLGDQQWIRYGPWEEEFAFLSGRKERTTTITHKSLTVWGTIAACLYLLGLPLGAGLMSKATADHWADTQKFLWLGLAIFALPFGAALLAWIWYRPNLRPWTRRFWTGYREGGDTFFGILIRQPNETTVTDTAKTTDPTSVEFREVFVRVINEALLGHSRRLVIVMDNLDRVDPTDALSVWSTMRIFFEFDGREQAGWNGGLWLIVPFDETALKRLWKNEESVDLVESFVNKTFQITFRVPPPVLTRWKEYFSAQFRQAFLEPADPALAKDPTLDPALSKDPAVVALAKNGATISRLYERLGPPSPSPREIKLFLNKLIASYLQRGSEIPLPLLALYLLRSKQVNGDSENLLKADGLQPRTLDLLDEDEWRAGWREYLGAIHFNVPRKDALHVLNSAKIALALESGDATSLQERIAEPGFWPVCEQVVYQKYGDWQAQPKLLASAVRSLNLPLPATEPDRSHALAIRNSLQRIAVSIQAWKEIDENVAAAVPIVAGYMNPANPDRRGLCERVLAAAAIVPVIGTQSVSPAISPAIESWVKGVRGLLQDSKMRATVPEKVSAFSVPVQDPAIWVQVSYLKVRDNADAALQVTFAGNRANLPEKLAEFAGLMPPDIHFARLVHVVRQQVSPGEWKDFESPLILRLKAIEPSHSRDAGFLMRAMMPVSTAPFKEAVDGTLQRLFVDACARADWPSAAAFLLPIFESGYAGLGNTTEDKAYAAALGNPASRVPIVEEFATVAAESSRADVLLEQPATDSERSSLAKEAIEVLIRRNGPVWPFSAAAIATAFDRLASWLGTAEMESLLAQFLQRGNAFPYLLEPSSLTTLTLPLYRRLLKAGNFPERPQLLAFILTTNSWLSSSGELGYDFAIDLIAEVGPGWLSAWRGASDIAALDLDLDGPGLAQLKEFQSTARVAIEMGSRTVDEIATEAQHKSAANANHLLDLAEFRARADAAMLPGNPAPLASWARVLCARSQPKTDADAIPLLDAAIAKCEDALRLEPAYDVDLELGIALVLKAKRTAGTAAIALLERAGPRFEKAASSHTDPALALKCLGDMLAERARRASGDEAARFWTAAIEKYEAAQAGPSPFPEAMAAHAAVLRDWAEYQPEPQAEATRKAAREKCQAAFKELPSLRGAAITEARLLLDDANWASDLVARALCLRAQERLQTVLAEAPDSVEALTTMGDAVAAQVRATPDADSTSLLPLVAPYYESALALRPDYVFARNGLGSLLRTRALRAIEPDREKLLTAAEQQYQAALGFRADSYRAENGIGNLHHDRKSEKTAADAEAFLNQAHAHYAAALTVKSDFYPAMANEANVLFDRGIESDGEEAERWFTVAFEQCQAALRILPGHYRALHRRGEIQRVRANAAESEEAAGLRAQAMADFQAALAVKPDYYPAWIGWARVAMNQADDVTEEQSLPLLDTAISRFEEALKVGHDIYLPLTSQADALVIKARRAKAGAAETLLTQAEEKCALALAAKPDYRYAVRTWGQALLERAKLNTGDRAISLIERAIEKLERAKQLKPDDHQAINSLGNALLDRAALASGTEAESFERTAISEYQKALEANPSYHHALANWGKALAAQAQRKRGAEAEELSRQAESKYREALAIKPNFAYAWQGLGRIFATRARMAKAEHAGPLWDAAIENFRRAVVAKSDYYWAFQLWGNALAAKAGQQKPDQDAADLLDAAIEKYEAASVINPDFAEALNACGSALLQRVRRSPLDAAPAFRARAREKFEAAIAIRPGYADALRNLGELDMTEIRWADAAPRFESVAKLRPDSWEIWKRWGDALADLAQTKPEQEAEPLYLQAEEKYAQALSLKPDYRDALYQWGRLYETRARRTHGVEPIEFWAQAEEKYEAALAIDPGYFWAKLGAAEAIAARARLSPDIEADPLYTEAYGTFEAAAKLWPSYEGTFSQWAEALAGQAKRKSGEEAEVLYGEADAKFREAVRLKPSDGWLHVRWGKMLAQRASQGPKAAQVQLWRRAAEEFSKGTELDPSINWYWTTWGDILVELAEQSEGEEAARLWAEAREKYERDPKSWASQQGLRRIATVERALKLFTDGAPAKS
jgi:tetratricopeptide (TPR) repeat protein